MYQCLCRPLSSYPAHGICQLPYNPLFIFVFNCPANTTQRARPAPTLSHWAPSRSPSVRGPQKRIHAARGPHRVCCKPALRHRGPRENESMVTFVTYFCGDAIGSGAAKDLGYATRQATGLEGGIIMIVYRLRRTSQSHNPRVRRRRGAHPGGSIRTIRSTPTA